MDVVSQRISLTAWGRLYGFDKATSARRHHTGRLPPEPRIERLPNGRCHVVVPPAQEGRSVVYARVASADRKADPSRLVGRVAAWGTQQSCRPDEGVKEIGSGPDGYRRRWRRRVAEHTVGTIVVEHRARVTRFGFKYVEAAWAGQGARIPVIEADEPVDDPARDTTEVPTSLCARLYGRRSARRRAERALAAVQAG
ncbi:MAG: IS607 family transposase [Rhodothermaceae bacterium]|nr:IS607 family transposase [Caldilineaceae bacterium SB0664_bin_22]MYH12347.1 IS607 family transposase [Rhodothermaceae bacterium]